MNLVNTVSQILNTQLPTDGNRPGIYFLGIGGIGMSALARYFNSNGFLVSGYDKTPTALSLQLEAEGMLIHYKDDVQLIDKAAVLVVYTPAIPATHSELGWYKANQYPVVKRSDVLGALTASGFNICVAGTHGKTTTSSMVAHLLRDTGFGCNAFLGGIAVNYNSNFWSAPGATFVAEADEYDRSFLKLSPDVAIISSMDADHLDIYGTAENMEQAFIDFAARIKEGGTLISKYGLKRSSELSATQHYTYGVNEAAADINAHHIRMNNGSYCFDLNINGRSIYNLELNMGGLHNIENATAAIAAIADLPIPTEKIAAALANFKGVKRRFEYVVKNNLQVLIDDYAHHPEELRALLLGAKNLFPEKKCTVVFQPHLYSRTSDHAAGFADALSLADEVFLLPIYPARELPMPGVSSQLIADLMPAGKVTCCTKEEFLAIAADMLLYTKNIGVMITAGAGDIDLLVAPLKELMEKNNTAHL
jgi:UDP-N-acetylmuramate--alanine ligase